jgi:ATP-dependent exoDNAse (exonuclease V) alpha subunit
MKKEAPRNVITVKQLEYDGNSQDFKLYKGLPLIARKNSKDYNIANNDTFIVEYVDATQVLLDNDVLIPLELMSKLFYPCYAMTIHKSQGSTFKEPYSIYEWDRLDKRLRYVALTRGDDIAYINIV